MKKLSRIMLWIAALILIAFGIYSATEPFRTDYNRDKQVNEGIDIIENCIENDVPVATMVVSKDDLSIDGEYEYDDEYGEYLENELDNLPEYITIEAAGILELPAIDIKIPVWKGATTITLRYGGGLFNGSDLPGRNTNTTILAHHMSSETMFHNLDKMQIGDQIIFTDLTGRVYRYEVNRTEVVTASEMTNYLYADSYGNETDTITLVTCTYTERGKMRLIVIGNIIED